MLELECMKAKMENEVTQLSCSESFDIHLMDKQI